MANATPSRLVRNLLTGIGLFIALTALWATLSDTFKPALTSSDVFTNGILRVGIDPSRPPFAAFDKDGGYVGIEIDIAHAFADELELPVVFVPLGFDGLYDALTTYQADTVIAGLQPIAYQDGNAAAYTRHYFNAGHVLVSEQSSITMRDIAGGRIAYTFGTPADALAHQWLRRVKPFTLMPYELPEYALDAARFGMADAALVDAATARQYLRTHDTWGASLSYVDHAWYTLAVRADRPDILHLLNHTLHTLDAQGTLDTILNQWL